MYRIYPLGVDIRASSSSGVHSVVRKKKDDGDE